MKDHIINTKTKAWIEYVLILYVFFTISPLYLAEHYVWSITPLLGWGNVFTYINLLSKGAAILIGVLLINWLIENIEPRLMNSLTEERLGTTK